MSTTYVPRAFGGTLILTVASPSASTVPAVACLVTFRDGESRVTFRDGETRVTFRDGVVNVGGR